MRILDFGAGHRAIHTLRMREMGLDVTAHDFGKNFVHGLHDPMALIRVYDAVMVSNVVNVHSTIHGIERTIGEAAIATGGFCVVNYPQEPRKFASVTPARMQSFLEKFFHEVDRVPKKSCPLWVCRGRLLHMIINDPAMNQAWDADEILAANIRPAGAVGANALVPRFTLELLGQRLDQAS